MISALEWWWGHIAALSSHAPVTPRRRGLSGPPEGDRVAEGEAASKTCVFVLTGGAEDGDVGVVAG